LTTLDTRFTDNQLDWQKRFGDAESDRRSRFEAQVVEFDKRSESARVDFVEVLSQETGKVEALEAKAREVLGTSAAAAVVGSYQREAETQRKAADFWRYVTAGTLAVALTLAVCIFEFNRPEAVSDIWQLIAAYSPRTAILAIAGPAATYAGRQSSAHRRREADARRLENELSTFRPFIVELDPDVRQDLTRKATDKFFRGQQNSAPDSIVDDVPPLAPQTTVNRALDTVRNFIGPPEAPR